MSVADIETKVAEAAALQETGDYAGAIAKLRSARILIAGLPDVTRAGGAGMRWDRASIDAMINDLQRARGAAAGIQTTKIRYRNVGCDDV